MGLEGRDRYCVIMLMEGCLVETACKLKKREKTRQIVKFIKRRQGTSLSKIPDSRLFSKSFKTKTLNPSNIVASECHQKRLKVKLYFKELGSGAHFNHSIWDKEGKTNLFWDPSKPDNMSDFARHWIAGLVKHTYAMTAILCPTVNCYRRMHGTWAPSGRTLLQEIKIRLVSHCTIIF